MNNFDDSNDLKNTTALTPRSDRPFAMVARGDSLGIVGTGMKHVKGEFLAGRSGEETLVPLGSEFAVDMSTAFMGFIKWQDGIVVDAHVLRIADGLPLPSRRDMGDNDKNLWPVADDGRKKDPWSPDSRALMIAVDEIGDAFCRGEEFTFYSSAWGGRIAFQKLCYEYDRDCDDHAGEMPVVSIGTYKRVSKQHGRIDTPSFQIVRWVSRDDLAAGRAGPPTSKPPSASKVKASSAESPSTSARRTLASAKSKLEAAE
jgi:hypothetical protein